MMSNSWTMSIAANQSCNPSANCLQFWFAVSSSLESDNYDANAELSVVTQSLQTW